MSNENQIKLKNFIKWKYKIGTSNVNHHDTRKKRYLPRVDKKRKSLNSNTLGPPSIKSHYSLTVNIMGTSCTRTDSSL